MSYNWYKKKGEGNNRRITYIMAPISKIFSTQLDYTTFGKWQAINHSHLKAYSFLFNNIILLFFSFFLKVIKGYPSSKLLLPPSQI